MIPLYDAVSLGVVIGVPVGALLAYNAVEAWRERRIQPPPPVAPSNCRVLLPGPWSAAASVPPRLAAAPARHRPARHRRRAR